MSRTIQRRLVAQSPLTVSRDFAPTLRLPSRCLRQFSDSFRRRAEEDPAQERFKWAPIPREAPRTPRATPQAANRSPSINPKATSSSSMAALSGLFSTNQLERKSRFTSAQISSDGEENIFLDEKDQKRQYLQNRPHLLSVYATRHNTHINFSRAWVQDEKDVKEGEEPKFAYKPLISLSAGNLGFRHSARKHYDSAFQTASYVMARMQERGLNREIKSLEVRLRGFGAGREAVTKAILGSEGRFIRDKITKVADNTRLKFGGTRSPKPRRLG